MAENGDEGMRFLVTGTAGFIGFHLARRLLSDGHEVYGVDGFTPYYDVRLKTARHSLLEKSPAFHPKVALLEDAEAMSAFADEAAPEVIVHLAGQAGVRYSLENPRAYVDANLVGSFNILEIAHKHKPRHLLLASTSSVYGGNTKMPFAEIDKADSPLTLYAASKKAMEELAHSYAHLWNIPTTAFRFFTVYGPWGRPDMALFKFVSATLAGKPIDVYGEGRMERDFTYVEDLVEAIVGLTSCIPKAGEAVSVHDSISSVAPFRVVNIGGGQPVGLLEFIKTIERCLGRDAKLNMLPMQPGDVTSTSASPDLLVKLTGQRPHTSINTGVSRFVKWYLDYHGPDGEPRNA